jgi:hypothetical protein
VGCVTRGNSIIDFEVKKPSLCFHCFHSLSKSSFAILDSNMISDSTFAATTPAIISASPKTVADLPDTVAESLEALDLNKPALSCSDDKDDEKKDDNAGMTSSWSLRPASQKSMRTQNPIRAIVDPIVKNIQSGADRGDGKDHISLAVSRDVWMESLLWQKHGVSLINISFFFAAG